MNNKTITIITILALIVILCTTFAKAAIPSGAITYYAFENNYLDSTGKHNGTNFGTTFATGKLGMAASFNQNGQYIDTNYNFPMGTGNMSVMAWVKTNDCHAHLVSNTIEGGYYGQSINEGWGINILGDSRTNSCSNGLFSGEGTGNYAQEYYFSSNKTLNDGQWHHVVMVRDSVSGDNSVKIYFDGKRVSASTLNPANVWKANGDANGKVWNSPTTRTMLGADPGLGYFANVWYVGLLDEVAIYDRALNDSEIEKYYNDTNGTTEVCDGIDNDLDSLIDEGNVCNNQTNQTNQTAPNVTLLYPTNNLVLNGAPFPMSFIFNVQGNSSVSSCTAYVTGTSNYTQTSNNITFGNNTIQMIMGAGNYSAYVSCLSGNLTGTSNSVNFTLNPIIFPPIDTKAPASITNLHPTQIGYTNINWAWTNPTDSDFAGTIIFKNGIEIARLNSSQSSYNMTGLTRNTYYTITVHTFDYSNNVNNTNVSDTRVTKKTAIIIPVTDDEDDYSPVDEEGMIVPGNNTTSRHVNGTAILLSNLNTEEETPIWGYLAVLFLILVIILAVLIMVLASKE